MVEPPTLADRKLVRRFPKSPDRLLRYEPPTEKFAIQSYTAHHVSAKASGMHNSSTAAATASLGGVHGLGDGEA